VSMNTAPCARCGHGKRFHSGTGLGSCGGAANTLHANCSCRGYEEPVTVVADDTPQQTTVEVPIAILEWVEGLEKGLITPSGQKDIAALLKPKPMPLPDRLVEALYEGDDDGETSIEMVRVVCDYLDENAQQGAAAMLRRAMGD